MVRQQPDRAISRYLLGQASRREQTRLEEEYFCDPDCLQRLLTVEDDLIDAYIRGELSRGERNQFERYFLVTPQRQEKARMARALLQCLHDVPAHMAADSPYRLGKQPIPRLSAISERLGRLAIAASFVVLVLGGIWLLVQNHRLQTQLGLAREQVIRMEQQERKLEQQMAEQAAQSEARARETEREGTVGQPSPESPTTSDRSPVVASFVLSPGVSRGIGDQRSLVVPPRTKILKLKLMLDTKRSYTAYRALLRLNGRTVWKHAIVNGPGLAEGGSITLNVLCDLLHSGNYQLALTGVLDGQVTEAIGDYDFTLLKK